MPLRCSRLIYLRDAAIELYLTGRPRMPLRHYKAAWAGSLTLRDGGGSKRPSGLKRTDYFSSWHRCSDSRRPQGELTLLNADYLTWKVASLFPRCWQVCAHMCFSTNAHESRAFSQCVYKNFSNFLIWPQLKWYCFHPPQQPVWS